MAKCARRLTTGAAGSTPEPWHRRHSFPTWLLSTMSSPLPLQTSQGRRLTGALGLIPVPLQRTQSTTNAVR